MDKIQGETSPFRRLIREGDLKGAMRELCGEPDPSDCLVGKDFQQYLNRELSDAYSEVFTEHLTRCPECADAYRDMFLTRRGLVFVTADIEANELVIADVSGYGNKIDRPRPTLVADQTKGTKISLVGGLSNSPIVLGASIADSQIRLTVSAALERVRLVVVFQELPDKLQLVASGAGEVDWISSFDPEEDEKEYQIWINPGFTSEWRLSMMLLRELKFLKA